MGEPFIGEIRMFAGSFPPNGWAFCNGQSMPISQNDTLYTLIGTTYGGDGQETFNLPDLQGRLPMHAGQGPGISQSYQLGDKSGVESVTLTTQQIPVHNHAMLASSTLAGSADPTGNILAQPPVLNLYFGDVPSVQLSAQSVLPIGGSQPHENMMPFLAISFIISLFGVFPTQN